MEKRKILFVCMGNICRSPAAEAILKSMAEKAKLDNYLEIDSAGTIDYHEGEEPNARMKYHAAGRGYFLKSIARKFNPKVDFEKFDYIITMDNEIFSEINKLDRGRQYRSKIHKMTEFNRLIEADEVPDPFLGSQEGFEKVLDILTDACRGLLNKLKDELQR